MHTRQGALNSGRDKIICNCICPGGMRTDMNEGVMVFFTEKPRADVEGVFAYFTRDLPPRRFADPSEIARICSYLASDDAAFVTGVVMPVDDRAAVVDVSLTTSQPNEEAKSRARR